jgi:MFS family permease
MSESRNIFSKNLRLGPNKLIYTFGAMILFFMIFDGIVAYLAPVVILEHGFSKTVVGLILSAAAVSGVVFDLLIYRIFKTAFYRKLFTVMFFAGFACLFAIWNADSIILYLAAMALWGFYYDLRGFGTIDFISRHSKNKEIASNFGIIQIFQAIGYILAPLVAGFLIFETVSWEPFAAASVFLFISIFFFVMLLLEARGKKQFIPPTEHSARGGIKEEITAWKNVGGVILPILALGAFSTLFDSFFMTIGPILAESLPMEPFDGIFMFAYYFPPLLIGGLIGSLTKRFGNKNTVVFGLFIGAVILSTIGLFGSSWMLVLIVFMSACFTCVMNPVVQSTYTHCIHSAPKVKKEVQELGDLFSNVGYIIGPIVAGIIADNLGNTGAFSALGLIGVAFAILLFVFMPKKISIK